MFSGKDKLYHPGGEGHGQLGVDGVQPDGELVCSNCDKAGAPQAHHHGHHPDGEEHEGGDDGLHGCVCGQQLLARSRKGVENTWSLVMDKIMRGTSWCRRW